jgi:hypothetical protein
LQWRDLADGPGEKQWPHFFFLFFPPHCWWSAQQHLGEPAANLRCAGSLAVLLCCRGGCYDTLLAAPPAHKNGDDLDSVKKS